MIVCVHVRLHSMNSIHFQWRSLQWDDRRICNSSR